MVATPEARWRSLSASMAVGPESSPGDVGPAEAGAVGASSRIVPSASTTRAEIMRPLIAPYRVKRLPDEFLPIMPPTVVTPLFAGSTPSERVRRPRCSSNCAATTPSRCGTFLRTKSSRLGQVRQRCSRGGPASSPRPAKASGGKASTAWHAAHSSESRDSMPSIDVVAWQAGQA